MSESHVGLSNELLVANSILRTASNDGRRITQMQLQKLLYFVYKKYLKETGKSLYGENFEVWQYGPVLPSVYREFKRYDASEIDDYAYPLFDTEKAIYCVASSEKEIYEAILFVWSKYRNYDGIQLSELTHRDETAWKKALERKDLYLKSDEIKLEEWKT